MITRRVKGKAFRSGLLAGIFVLMLSSASQAGPLGINLLAYPDLSVAFINSSYNALTQQFTATGLTRTLDTGTKQTVSQVFSLTASISNTGIMNGGTLLIGSAASPALQSLSLVGFNFDPVAAGQLEFLFANVSGSYVGSVYDSGSPVDVTLSLGNTNFLGSFAGVFSGTSGTADVKSPNPEPSELALMFVGGLALIGTFRRRSLSA